MESVGSRYAVFDTAIGRCGIAWSDRGLTRLQLPEADAAATEARLARTSGARASTLPTSMETVIAEVRRYCAGQAVDFGPIELDLNGVPPFHQEVYEAARAVAWGETVTYGELARRIASPGAARAVGQALGRNPMPIIVPCHRVLASGRKMGGFSAYGGVTLKERLLAMEGVRLQPEPTVQAALSFEGFDAG